jgi:cyclase
MKRLAVLASIVVAGVAAAGLSAQAPAGPGEIERIADNVYKIFGAGGNTTVFVRSEGVALVDTKLAGNGEAILARVRQVTDKPVTLIINTHSHGDHVGSNAEIGGRARVEVVAHSNTARRMTAMTEPLPVAESFHDRLKLGSGADRIDLYWFGAGHTDGDAFVVFPAARTMAAGDIYQLQAMPRIDRASGGSALALPVTLTQALYDIKGVDKVIDGHGDKVRSWEEFRSYVTFTRAVAQAALQTQRMGGTPEQALASLERNPGFLLFLGDAAQPGGPAGNTPKARALTALTTAFAELRGE